MYDNRIFTRAVGIDAALDFTPVASTNISGWTLSFTVVAQLPQTFPALLTVVPAILDATAGTIRVTLTSAQLKALGAGTFCYSLWRTDSGSADELGSGQMILSGTARRLP